MVADMAKVTING